MASVQECAYCGREHEHGDTVPKLSDDDAWGRLAAAHVDTCEWIATRAHQRDAVDLPPRDLLALAIERSGLSARAFARDVLWRDDRTVRRWLAGESPVPAVVADRLREELAPSRRDDDA